MTGSTYTNGWKVLMSMDVCFVNTNGSRKYIGTLPRLLRYLGGSRLREVEAKVHRMQVE